jgi:hypothetical protein
VIQGWFDETTGRPQLRARVAIRDQLVDDYVVFDVDTGADFTIVSATHARLLEIDFGRLAAPMLVSGVGGVGPVVPADAVVILEDPELGFCTFRVEIGIFAGDPPARFDRLPSLLGRDVLDWVRMIYHGAAPAS